MIDSVVLTHASSISISAQKAMSSNKVTLKELQECFDTRLGGVFQNNKQKQDELTAYWFISETYRDRQLKIVFYFPSEDSEQPVVITLMEPDKQERDKYNAMFGTKY
jgi:hypothetical protein